MVAKVQMRLCIVPRILLMAALLALVPPPVAGLQNIRKLTETREQNFCSTHALLPFLQLLADVRCGRGQLFGKTEHILICTKCLLVTGHRIRSSVCLERPSVPECPSPVSWINAAGTLTALLHITRGGGAARCHPITIYTAQLWHGGVKTAA